jgi:predicted RNase H-like nuclease (RuvC/YqgF family)
MFVDLPQNLILMVAGAFLVGWLLSSVSSSLGSRPRAKERDPKDVRIRSLEAELRVAQGAASKADEKLEALEKDLQEALEGNEKRDNVISHQQERIEKLSRDLKDSVLKTRELRCELSERATENLKSEVKLREVETELEVAQASTDLIATGVLDYSLAPDSGDNSEDLLDEAEMIKTGN